VVVTKSDSGKDTFNSSLLAGTVLSKTLTNLYYPRPERGFEPTASRIGGALLGDIQTNLLLEFGPDIERFFRKREPNKIEAATRSCAPPEEYFVAKFLKGGVG
jgi:hypothetical protein